MPEPSAEQPSDTLRDAFRALDPNHPLETRPERERWYVPRGDGVGTGYLRSALEMGGEDEVDKWLFTGHRGAGKSTELARLADDLDQRLFVVRFTVEESLNLGDIQYHEVLVSIGSHVFQEAKRHNIRLSSEVLNNLVSWYSETFKEVEKITKGSKDVESRLDTFFLKLGARLGREDKTREYVRETVQRNLSDLLDRLNLLLRAIREEVKRPILVIVDGLDKVYDLDQVRKLFLLGANALLEPECKAVYTVPLALCGENDLQQVRASFSDLLILPCLAVHAKGSTAPGPGAPTMCAVLEKRVPQGVLADGVAELLTLNSAGLPKQLMQLAREAVTFASARASSGQLAKIEATDVEKAVARLRETFRLHLTSEQYEQLARIQAGESFVNTPVTQQLIHNLSLLQYDGGETWWAVQPVVVPLLEEWQAQHQDDPR